MTGLPGTPAQVQPGVIVRIRLAGIVYSSRRLTRDDAVQTAAAVKARLRSTAGLVDLPEFPSADLEELSLVANKVIAVEVRCVNGSGALIRDREPHDDVTAEASS